MYYKVCLYTKIKPQKLATGSGILVLEPDDYTKEEIKAIRKKGYKLLGYLSVGTIEKERSWYKTYKKYKLQQLQDWPNEWDIDVTKDGWQKFLLSRAQKLKDKGFDGFWCDNLDVYQYNKKLSIFNACQKILKSLKPLGYVMVNGGSEFFDVAMDKKLKIKSMVNGVTQEEVFSLIKNYSGKGTFDKQEKGQSQFYKKYMKRLKTNGAETFLLSISKLIVIFSLLSSFCESLKRIYGAV